MNTVSRKTKEERPVLAICYDFDKTLSPTDMQAQGYIQEVFDGDVSSFWKESNEVAEKNEMDTNLAYMFKMVQEARGRIVLTRKSLEDYGARVELFPGVEEWFERIREFGDEHGVMVEHYIISSGLKEMIMGTSVARAGAFEKIYASSFLYDEKDVPVWPAQVVNFTNKTQFLFRIEKGTLDVNDSGVNDYFSPDQMRVPFRNMVYIGDSDTDIPCMKLVNSYGGHSIGVYNNDTLDKTKVFKMIRDNRIKYYAPADYTEGSELDQLIKSIIIQTAANEALVKKHFECREESNQGNLDRHKLDLIASLANSGSFATTHTIIRDLDEIENWTERECEMLLSAALNNFQVRYVLVDEDVRQFFRKVIKSYGHKNDLTKEVENGFSVS